MEQGLVDEALRVRGLLTSFVCAFTDDLTECKISRDPKYPCLERRYKTPPDYHTSTDSHLDIDPPRGEEYWIPTDPRFSHAIDLLSYIKNTPEFASHFCVGVAGRLRVVLLAFSTLVLTFALIQLILMVMLIMRSMKRWRFNI